MMKPTRAVLWATPVVVAVFFSVFYFLRDSCEMEDAFIYLRYVRNLFEGKGLVFNAGERVNSLTSPLFTLLVAAGSLVSRQYLFAAWAISVAGHCLLLAVFMRLFYLAAGAGAALLGGLLAASCHFFYATYAMETTLFVALAGLCVLLYGERKWQWLSVASGLLLLTRMEGVFLLAAIALVHRRKREPWPRAAYALVPAGMVAAAMLFDLIYYGSPLPWTLTAKIDLGRSGAWSSLHDVTYLGGMVFHDRPILALPLSIFAGLGLFGLRRAEISAVAIPFCALLAIFYEALRIPNNHWYYAPFFAFWLFYAGAGVVWLAREIPRKGEGLWRRAPSLAIYCIAGFLIFELLLVNLTLGRPVDRHYRRIGLWLNERVPVAASVAAAEVGALGWHTDRAIIDILGVVTPGNSALLAGKQWCEWIAVNEPDYVLVHDPPWPWERCLWRAAREGSYASVREFKFGGFRLFRKAGGAGRLSP